MKKLLLFSATVWLCTAALAQSGNPLYKNYKHCLLQQLQAIKHTSGMEAGSVHALRRQAASVKENTPVSLPLVKKNKKARSGREMVRQHTGSVLMLCKYRQDASPRREEVVFRATGAVLSPDGICVTNYHVLYPIIDKDCRQQPGDSLHFAATHEGTVYPIVEVLSYNKEADLALFRIDTRGERLRPIPLGDDLEAGDDIHALTHPEGHPYYYSRGVVARTLCTDPYNPFTYRTEVTADYAKGSSGGPLFDNCGNLVGLVSTTQSIYYTDDPQTNLQMVVKAIIPVSTLKRLLSVTK